MNANRRFGLDFTFCLVATAALLWLGFTPVMAVLVVVALGCPLAALYRLVDGAARAAIRGASRWPCANPLGTARREPGTRSDSIEADKEAAMKKAMHRCVATGSWRVIPAVRSSHKEAAVALLAALAAVPASGADEELKALQEEVETLKQTVNEAVEWRRVESHAHLAGYAAVTYINVRGDNRPNDSFGGVQFNPIFHYQFLDKVLLESELELAIEPDGGTEAKLEYLSVDFFLNDYLFLVAGKYLSPLGQFRQNLHPAWINRLALAPAGFGVDEAAPMSEIGLQLRGGAPLGLARLNYALYVGNGPELDADMGEIMAIMTDGVARDEDGRKVVGGRLGIIPLPRLEIGASAASGEAVVTVDGGAPLTDDPRRDYRAAGADLNYSIGGFRFLAEYLQQKIGDVAGSVAPLGGEWRAWYAQASYLLQPGGWEAVVRYGRYNPPGTSLDQEQTAVGINYWVAPQAVAKLTYERNHDERNHGEAGSDADRDRILAQAAYGF